MRICLDVSPAVHRRAGLGRYVQELVTALVDCHSGDEYVAFYNRPSEAQVSPPLDRLVHLTTSLNDKPWRLRVLLAHLLGISQDRRFPGVDLFHATDNLLPRLSRSKSVFTLYDLAFRIYPGTHTSLNRWFLTLMMPRFLHIAGEVIAISESTRRDAIRLYGVDKAKIKVIPIGVSSRFRRVTPDIIGTVRSRYALPEHYILFVGTIEPRKNLVALLEAFAALRKQESSQLPGVWKLVIVGKKGWLHESFFQRLRELDLDREVVFPDFVPDDDLPAVYSGATLFVYPSWYEGFGLPVLEAMACGTPVVCSNTSSLPEVAGDAALMVEPHDVRALKETLSRLLADAHLRDDLTARGLTQAAQFTWQKTAEQTLSVYRAVTAGGQD